ncbi:MAG: diacylglycerol kinase family lipid kinase [Clostridia bacterium]|nr:diacylglycerol kinase family lipid kinase [Clostridia bacterium]
MFHIIYNPTSGQKKTVKTAEFVRSELEKAGCEVTFHPTLGAGHCTDIVRELSGTGEDVNIIIIGGDGTFSEAINGVVDFDKVTFGLIPCGTGNDFARKIGISSRPKRAVKAILGGKVDHLDYLDIGNGDRCLNVCGMGMDVDVLVKYASMKHFTGKIKYYLSLFYVLTHFKGHTVRYKIGDIEGEQEVFMAAIANGSYIGGGMAISAESDVRDGKLELVVIDNIKKSVLPYRLIKFLSGKMHLQPCTHIFSGEEAEIEILDQPNVQIDGEVRPKSKLKGKIVRGKLRIFL